MSLGTRATCFLPIFGIWSPGTSPIRSAAKFPAISRYRFVRSSHMGPVQAKNRVPAKIFLIFISILNCRWGELGHVPLFKPFFKGGQVENRPLVPSFPCP